MINPQIKQYIAEEQLLEGLKYFKLSTKVEKLLAKVKHRVINLPDKEEKTDAEQVIELLGKEILPKIREIERKYANNRISAFHAKEEIKKLQPKVKQIKKILQADEILPKHDWLGTVSSLMWIPMALTGWSVYDLYNQIAKTAGK
jgi:hypothetical protein